MSMPANDDGGGGRKRRLEDNHAGSSSTERVSSSATYFPQFPPPSTQPSNAVGEGLGDVEKDPYCGDDDLFDPANLPNDTMATVMYLKREFYAGKVHAKRNERRTPTAGAVEGDGIVGGGERTGIVLQHQIYTVLQNRTAVDLELTAMRRDNILRTFRISTGREEWGVMSTEHYLRLIRIFFGEKLDGAREKSQNADRNDPSRSSYSGRPPAGKVLERLVRTTARAYASRKEVSNVVEEVSLDLAGRPENGGGPSRIELQEGGNGKRRRNEKEARKNDWGQDEEGHNLDSLKRKEEGVLVIASELIRAGFLLPRRDVGREEAYWFSLPQLGKVIVSISRGRKGITGALRRTRYKEMRRSALEAKNPARGTGFPVGFHIRDLLGLGVIKQLDTPSGEFLRLVQDA